VGWRPGVAALAGLGCMAGLVFARRRGGALTVFAALFLGVALWWSTLAPPAQRDWASDVARQTTGEIVGDRLILRDIRAFDWTGPHEARPAWIDAEYDLATLQSVDLIMSCWAGPVMAHMILSFGFADGRYLAWSVEVRRGKDGVFSPIADFFKEHTLSIVAAEERDVVGLRALHRGEDVQIFRLRARPETARAARGIPARCQSAGRTARLLQLDLHQLHHHGAEDDGGGGRPAALRLAAGGEWLSAGLRL